MLLDTILVLQEHKLDSTSSRAQARKKRKGPPSARARKRWWGVENVAILLKEISRLGAGGIPCAVGHILGAAGGHPCCLMLPSNTSYQHASELPPPEPVIEAGVLIM